MDPALAADGAYVAAAYGVFVALVVVYVTILAVRHRRARRELAELERRRAEREHDPEAAAPRPEVLA